MALPFCSHAGSPGGASGCRGDSRPCDERQIKRLFLERWWWLFSAFGSLKAVLLLFQPRSWICVVTSALRRHPFYWLFLGSLLWSGFQIKRRRKSSVCRKSTALHTAVVPNEDRSYSIWAAARSSPCFGAELPFSARTFSSLMVFLFSSTAIL